MCNEKECGCRRLPEPPVDNLAELLKKELPTPEQLAHDWLADRPGFCKDPDPLECPSCPRHRANECLGAEVRMKFKGADKVFASNPKPLTEPVYHGLRDPGSGYQDTTTSHLEPKISSCPLMKDFPCSTCSKFERKECLGVEAVRPKKKDCAAASFCIPKDCPCPKPAEPCKPSTVGESLLRAHNLINGDRRSQYGSVEDSFRLIADFWNIYISSTKRPFLRFQPSDVAMMMSLMKVAREAGRHQEDNLVDGAAYLALANDLVEKGL